MQKHKRKRTARGNSGSVTIHLAQEAAPVEVVAIHLGNIYGDSSGQVFHDHRGPGVPDVVHHTTGKVAHDFDPEFVGVVENIDADHV